MTRDDVTYAEKYAKVSDYQFQKGKLLLDLAKPENGEVVLDLGCGTGGLTFKLANRVGAQGNVFAVDPDIERLSVAQETIPSDINNITFLNVKAEKLTGIADSSIDMIYSNYVIHWIPDKIPMLKEAIRCLRPDGRFVMELVGDLPPFVRAITLLAGEQGKKLVDKFFCLTLDEWIALFEDNGLIVEHADWPISGYEYSDLSEFFDWWEGTTNGAFLRSMISDDSMDELQKEHSGKISFCGSAFQGIVRKQ